MNAFLRGEHTMDAEFQELVTRGKKTQQEVDAMIQLANEVQYAILTKKLGPGACRHDLSTRRMCSADLWLTFGGLCV